MTECIGMLGGHAAMMWTFGVFALLIVAIVLLGAAALVKYLFFDRDGRGGTGNALAAAPSAP
jgi:hypothetical protein